MAYGRRFDAGDEAVNPLEVWAPARVAWNIVAEAAPSSAELECGGRRYFNASSDDLLGLGADARVREASALALRRFGAGGAVVSKLQAELEEKAARLLGTEAALLLGSPAELVLALGDAHRSVLVESRTLHQLTLAGDRSYSSPEELERALSDQPALVVSCAVHRLEGDLAPLPRYAELVERREGTLIAVDGCGLGVLGPSGGGAVEYLATTPPPELTLARLSLALAGAGYACGARRELVEALRPLELCLSAPVAAAASRAIDIVHSEPQRRTRLFDLTEQLVRGLRSAGFDTGPAVTPWVPVWVGDEALGEQWLRGLADVGVACRGSLARARSRLLLSLAATTTDAQVDALLEAFDRVGRHLGRPEERETNSSPVVLARPGNFVLAAPCAARWLAGTVSRPVARPAELPSQAHPLRTRLLDTVETLTWRAANLQAGQLRRLLDTRALRVLLERGRRSPRGR